MMEDEIDLRAYIEVLLRHWKWIVGLAVAAAVAAFAISAFLLSPTYEASSVVLVTEPRFQIEFDPQSGTEERTPAFTVLPILAASDSILQEVVDSYQPSPEAGLDPWNISTLAETAEAAAGGDPSLVLLTVTSSSAEDSAGIANLWADVLAQRGSEIYGGSQEDVTFFEGQLAQAEAALDQAERALVQFEARNQASIMRAQLDSHLQAQANYLADQRTIAGLVQDIQGLRSQLAKQSGNPASSLADNLTALLLQIRAFNAQTMAPIQLQIDGGMALSDKSQAEQLAFLEGLVVTLQDKSAEVDTLLAELEPQILDLQQKLQEITTEYDGLARARNLAGETYLTLARKLEETRIAAQEQDGTLQVGSYAAVPEKPVGPRRLLNTAVAGMLALMVGAVLAFVIEFWRQNGGRAGSDEE